MTMLPYGRHEITDADIEAVVAVLRSDFLTQGPAVPAFEEAVAAYCRAGYAVAANSATSALHLACLAVGVGGGDRVWTSPITFVASANCALYCGATVDFVDVEPDTCNMSPVCLEAKLRQAEATGNLPKAVIPVHFAGQPCDMAAIHELGRQYGFRIIEDASHAIGASYKGDRIGSCRYSDITIFSFHPVKIVTTAEGGMALTSDAELAERMRLLRSHGITRDAAQMTHEPDGPWYYQQIALGFNYRMTDVQAALGISQLQRIDDYIARRHRLAERYDEMLAALPVLALERNKWGRSSQHLYVIRLQLERLGRSHKEVFDSMRRQGIGVNLHYIPVYTHPYYQHLGYEAAGTPEAERYYAEAISLPLYPAMNEDDQFRVVSALRSALT